MDGGRVSNTFQTLEVTVSAPGTAEQVSAFYVPDGFLIDVTARRTNENVMYVAETKTKAQSGARKILIPGQSRKYALDNTARLWVDAVVSTDVLEIAIESDTAGAAPA